MVESFAASVEARHDAGFAIIWNCVPRKLEGTSSYERFGSRVCFARENDGLLLKYWKF